MIPFFYKELFNQIKDTKIDSLQTTFCKLTNLSGSNVELEVLERKISGDKYCDLLQAQDAAISQVSAKILCNEEKLTNKRVRSLKNDIAKILETINPSEKKAPIVELLLHNRLYNHAKDCDQTERIETVLDISENEVICAIKTHLAKSQETTIERTLEIADNFVEHIIDTVMEEEEKLEEATNKYRKFLLRHLLNNHENGSLRKFMLEYRETYPKTSLTLEKLKGYRDGEESLDLRYVKRLAAVFGVKESLFYPSHFAEEQ